MVTVAAASSSLRSTAGPVVPDYLELIDRIVARSERAAKERPFASQLIARSSRNGANEEEDEFGVL